MELLVFVKGRKAERPKKNPRNKAKTNKKLDHICYRVRPHRWKPSAFTTEPSLLSIFSPELEYIVTQTRNIKVIPLKLFYYQTFFETWRN